MAKLLLHCFVPMALCKLVHCLLDCNVTTMMATDLPKELAFELVRTCSMEFYYGPEGLDKMKNTGKLYANDRNDMLLVLVKGSLICYNWSAAGETPSLTIHLIQHLPAGSFFSNCYSGDKTLATINFRGKSLANTQPFIIGAIFAERRCWGLFFLDKFRMHYKEHKLVIEHNCGDLNWGEKRVKKLPLFELHTGEIVDRMAEIQQNMILLNTPEEVLRYRQQFGPLEACPKMPEKLEGKRKLPRESWWTSLDACLAKLNKKHWNVANGGAWKPKDCVAQQRVAIMIPHRNREGHLCGLLYYLHGFLQKQQADYRVFVIDQAYPPEGQPRDRFNRAKLFNAGFLEILKLNSNAKEPDFDCFIMHDVDMVPESEFNLYRCNHDFPKRFPQCRECQNYWILNEDNFGGVVGFTGEQYVRLNGFSNYFWGWGHEDNEMSLRIRNGPNYKKFVVTDLKNASYMSLDMDEKPPDKTNPPIIDECTTRLLETTLERMFRDGVNNMAESYKVFQIDAKQLYTNISLDLMFWESIYAADFPCRDLLDKMGLPMPKGT